MPMACADRTAMRMGGRSDPDRRHWHRLEPPFPAVPEPMRVRTTHACEHEYNACYKYHDPK